MKFIWIIVFGFYFSSLFGQGPNVDYLLCLVEIQNSTEIRKAVRKTFKKNAFHRKKGFTISVSGFNVFTDIGPLIRSIPERIKDTGISPEIFDGQSIFRDEYKFDPEENAGIPHVLKKESGLTVYFSKRFGNVLAAEIVPFTTKLEMAKVRFGKSIVVLFFFDESGFIKDAEFRVVQYN